MKANPDDYPAFGGARQVVMIEPVWRQFLADLRARGLDIGQIPSAEDDLPTYTVIPPL